MMNPLYPHAAEKARMRRSVGSSCNSFAMLGLNPIQVHRRDAKSGSHVCTRRYRYRRSKLNTQSFCTEVVSPANAPILAVLDLPAMSSSAIFLDEAEWCKLLFP